MDHGFRWLFIQGMIIINLHGQVGQLVIGIMLRLSVYIIIVAIDLTLISGT